jgi:hypothetical protein
LLPGRVTVDLRLDQQFPRYAATDHDWLDDLALGAIFICLALTPAFMFLMGLKKKTWHWAFIVIAEVTVIAFVLCSDFLSAE